MIPGAFPIMVGRASVAITHTDTDFNTVSATSHSFSVSIGTADAARDVIIGLKYAVVGTPSVSVTINGNTAPMITGSRANAVSAYSELHRLNVPTGTTATVGVTSGASTVVYIAVWSVLNALTEFDVATSSSNNPSLSIDTQPQGGVLVFASSNGTNITGFTWSGVTEEFDVDTTGDVFSGGSVLSTTTATLSVSATVAFSGGGGVGSTVASAVAF